MIKDRSHPLLLVIQNALFVILSRVVDLATVPISMAILARYLHKDLCGEYLFVLAVAALVVPGIDFGVARVLIRDMNKTPERSQGLLGSALLIRFFISLAVLASAWALSGTAFASERVHDAFLIAILSSAFLAVDMLFVSAFYARERMQYDTLFSLLHSLLFLAGTVVVAGLDLGFVAIFWMRLIVDGLRLLTVSAAVRFRCIPGPWRLDRALGFQLLREGAPLGIFGLLTVGTFHVDAVVLRWLRSAQDVADYAIPHSFLQRGYLIPQAISIALFPVLSRLAAPGENPEHLSRVIRQFFKVLLAMGCGLSLVFYGWSALVVKILLGEEYASVVPCFRLLGFVACYYFTLSLLNFSLIAIGRQAWSTVSVAICLVTNFFLDLAWIPKGGAVGACWATVVAYTVYFVADGLFLSRWIRCIPSAKEGLGVGLATVAAAPWMILFADRGPVTVGLASIAAGLSFAGVLLLTRAFTWRDLKETRALMKPQGASVAHAHSQDIQRRPQGQADPL